ncbi:MAG: helix-turn-helix domain-containing protein [Caldicoprobacterales bacterium]|jgi:two-component system response regulator YesN
MKNSPRRLNRKQKKLLYQLVLSYMAVLIIPVFVLSILINNSIIIYSKEKVIGANLMKLQVMQGSIDSCFNEIKNSAITIAHDKRTDSIHTLKRADTKYSFDSVLKVMDVMQLFKETWGLKSYIHSMYLYNADERLVISSFGGLHKEEDFYDTAWIDAINDQSSFEIYVTDVRKPVNPVSPNDIRMSGVDEDVLTFIFPLEYIKFRGAVAINVRYDDLFKDLKPLPDHPEIRFVVEQQGRMLFNGLDEHNEMDIDSSVIIENVLNNSDDYGHFMHTHDNQEYLVTFWKSKISNLVFISLDNTGRLFDKIFLFKTLLLSVSASLVIVGLFLSYMMSRKIYSPIGKVLEELKSHLKIDVFNNKNELALIYDAVNELVTKGRETEQIISMNRDKLMEAQIAGLVMGRISDHSEYAFLQDYNACLLISLDKYKELARNSTNEEQQEYKSIMLNISNQIVNTYARGYSAVLQADKIVMIISLNKDQLDEFDEISSSICNRLIDETSSVKNISISLALGGLYQGYANIRKSFIEAEETLNYRFFYGYGSCIRYEDVKKRKEVCSFFQEKDNYVINYLQLNAKEEFYKLVKDFAECLTDSDDVTYESVVQTVIHLVSRVTEHLAALNITMDHIFEENSNVYLEIIGIETLDLMCEWLCSFYGKVSSYLDQHAERMSDKKYVAEIVEIIEKNYMWADLDIQWVAEQLNLSYSHTRRIFKEQIGMNFLDYLNKTRIEHAKKLLANSDYTVAEVALRSGYNNDQAFNRFFKKFEGITPGMYRVSYLKAREAI